VNPDSFLRLILPLIEFKRTTVPYGFWKTIPSGTEASSESICFLSHAEQVFDFVMAKCVLQMTPVVPSVCAIIPEFFKFAHSVVAWPPAPCSGLRKPPHQQKRSRQLVPSSSGGHLHHGWALSESIIRTALATSIRLIGTHRLSIGPPSGNPCLEM
jgi:hypothetical protein